jgi:tetratricopeptide (TPR) repeat protein
MKKNFALTLVTALAVCATQLSGAEPNKKTNEANKLAREGADAAKNKEFDKAVELLRKAADMDHKYSDELSAVYQQRGYAAASNQQMQEAISDYTEAIKLTPKDVRVYEQRAAVEMKLQNYDKALEDYSEVIKLKPDEIRYLNYRAYIYELKKDFKNSLADTEKALKLDPNNQEAKARKQRLEQIQADNAFFSPAPPARAAPKTSPPGKKKP